MASTGQSGGDDDGGWDGRAIQVLGAILVAVLLAFLAYYLLSGFFGHRDQGGYGNGGGNISNSSSTNCGASDCAPAAANGQQTAVLQPLPRQPLPEAVREWRRAAWQRDDIFAQITLGDLYSRDDSFYDPVEAYVWYFMALRDDHAYDTSAAAYPAMQQLFNHAQDRESALFDSMSLEQRLEARRRLIYILACRGSDGYITLGRLHRDYYSVNGGVCRSSSGGYGSSGGSSSGSSGSYGASSSSYDTAMPWWQRIMGYQNQSVPSSDVCSPPPATAIVLSNADAMMYFDIAQQLGHPLAPSYVSDQENLILDLPHGSDIISDARSRARNWRPDLEFYQGQTRGGTVHSDECVETTQRHQALLRVGEIPQPAIYHALLLQSAAKLDPPRDPRELDAAVRRYQEMQQDDVTGLLSPEETVHLIQMGAVDGDAQSQVSLGIMYTKGVGVQRNFVRAAYWFGRADLQGSGEATYYLGVLYKVGVDGIPHDADKAARLFTEAALRGYDPSRSMLVDMLAPPHGRDEHHEDLRPDDHHPEHHHRDHHRRPPQ